LCYKVLKCLYFCSRSMVSLCNISWLKREAVDLMELMSNKKRIMKYGKLDNCNGMTKVLQREVMT